MHQRSRHAQPTQMFQDAFELSLLLLDTIIGEDFRGSKMRENTLTFDVRARRQRSREARHVAWRKSQAVHARLEFHVELDPAARARRGALEQAQLLAACDGRRQLIFD